MRKQRAIAVDIKEIQLRPVTGESDIIIKAKQAKKFLETGDKVKVTVKFRGREKNHKEEGRKIIEIFLSGVGDHKVDKQLTEGDSDLTIILASNISKSEKQRKEHLEN